MNQAIFIQMKKSGLSKYFILNAVKTVLMFEGVSDIMNIWSQEKDEIIADIQDMVDKCSQKGKTEEIYVKFNDLETTSKDSLLQLVVEQGGITKLSELTHIPQPSWSGIFNSNSMPRWSTILRIAKALNLDELRIDL